MLYNTRVIDSFFGLSLYQIMVLSSTVVSYNVDFGMLSESIMLLNNVDKGPMLYDLILYSGNAV